MNEVTAINLDRIATEINVIKQHTKIVVLSASIEIGKKLKDAKQMVEHGKWSNWLEKNVDYSQRTANNLMKIYDEYGTKQGELLVEYSNSQALANLTYTQAVSLLSVPAEEREEFLENSDVNNMTTRELQEAIKAKNKAEENYMDALNGKNELNRALNKSENMVAELNAKIQSLESSDNAEELKAAQDALAKEKVRVRELNQKLEAKPKVVEVIPEAIEKELKDLKAKANEKEVLTDESPLMIKFKLQFTEIIEGTKKLMDTMQEVRKADDAEGDKCQGAFVKLLNRTLEGLG